MGTLSYILGVLHGFAQLASIVPGISIPATEVDTLLQIAQAAVKAHEVATGQPLDLSLLHEIAPVADNVVSIQPTGPAAPAPTPVPDPPPAA